MGKIITEALPRRVEALKDAGIPAEQVVIYDRTEDELTGAAYTINETGPGARCRATGSNYDLKNYTVADRPVGLSKVLLDCDALVSTLKEAASWPYWRDPIQGDSILMSFDPVAADAVGLQHWIKLKEAHGEDTKAPIDLAKTWLKTGADLGVGTDDLANIDFVEVKLNGSPGQFLLLLFHDFPQRSKWVRIPPIFLRIGFHVNLRLDLDRLVGAAVQARIA